MGFKFIFVPDNIYCAMIVLVIYGDIIELKGGGNMKKDVEMSLKLSTSELDTLTSRLDDLTAADTCIHERAYAGVTMSGPCGCKGSCEGGCTSW